MLNSVFLLRVQRTAILAWNQKSELKTCCEVIESQDHQMVWVGRDLKHHLVPGPLPWAGTPFTTPGCSKPHPTWP